MKKLGLIVLLCAGLVACGKDKDAGCNPNSTLVTSIVSVDQTKGISADNILIVEDKPGTIVSENIEQRLILRSGRTINIPADGHPNGESAPTVIDFNNNTAIMEGQTMRFSVDQEKSAIRGHTVYSFDEASSRKALAQMAAQEGNADVRACGVSEAKINFSYNEGNKRTTFEASVAVDVQLSQRYYDAFNRGY